MPIEAGKYRRFLLTLGSLADLGPMLAGERKFQEVADAMLHAMMETAAVREGVLFTFSEKPPQLSAMAWSGMALFPQGGYIPLLARQVQALASAPGPEVIAPKGWDKFLSSSGNVAPELFKCIVPLRVGAKLAGAVTLGAREGGANYEDEELAALGTIANYVALGVHNHSLTEALQARVVENLKLLDSMHGFCDEALEVIAAAIDAKEFRNSGHSLRVGRYAAAMGSALGMNPNEVAELRSSGYLHDIGKVTVDKRLFTKPSALEPTEFREMADHTVVGHRIVTGVQFPWPRIADVVRWHHERNDGSGYPDHLQKNELSLPVKIVGLADTFDAMIHERPYRGRLTVGQALSEIVRNAPAKYDGDVVQGLLTLVRGEASGRGQAFLDPEAVCNIGPSDIDQLAADLKYKINHGRVYSA
ncbi:MAG TPA: HD domain-containing phosphohydrolase [Terriglobales bacterium]|nr:HD domain-containing phosphohydrolase [Terriglobales bacterium]